MTRRTLHAAPAVSLDDLPDAELEAHFRAEIRTRTAAPFVLPTGPIRRDHPLRDRGFTRVTRGGLR